MRRAGLTAVAAGLLLAGCGSSPAGERDSRSDSAGVALVRLASAPAPVPAVWTSRTVFSTQAIDSLHLGEVVEAAFLGDTSLLIANGSEVIRLSRAGSFMQRIGRAGEGPGEFRNIFRLGVTASGTAFVGDLWSGRFTELSADGRVIRIVSRLMPGAGGRETEPVTVTADGRVLALPWQWRPNHGDVDGVSTGGLERDSVMLLGYGNDGTLIDTLGFWPGLERARVHLGREEARLPIPFARSVVYDGRGNHTIVGVSDSLDLSLFDGTRLVLRLTAPRERRAPTSADAAAWKANLLRRMPDIAASIIGAERRASTVSDLPNVGAVVLDDAGNIWVGGYVTAGQRLRPWRTFSSNGVLTGTLELPAHTDPLMPTKAELLDVFADRIAVLHETDDGEYSIEVRSVQQSAR